MSYKTRNIYIISHTTGIGNKKMNIAVKWIIRDLTRHKSRLAMTLVGIADCVVLMVGF